MAKARYLQVADRDAKRFSKPVLKKIHLMYQGTWWEAVRFQDFTLAFIRRNKFVKRPPEGLVKKITDQFAIEDAAVIHES